VVTSPVAAAVWAALEQVADPEIPAVSVVDMGMIERVEVAAGRARVTVLPTFTGCPALTVIRRDVKAAVTAVEGIDEADVDTTFTPPWDTSRITDEGRRKLRSFGLAPPGEGTVLITEIGLPKTSVCPFCGSTETAAENLFGPTPCRALYYCRSCRNPFEQFKTV
jgi:ring-1,2-phenylacetyl-CoA epoxidase subunit PaaD